MTEPGKESDPRIPILGRVRREAIEKLERELDARLIKLGSTAPVQRSELVRAMCSVTIRDVNVQNAVAEQIVNTRGSV